MPTKRILILGGTTEARLAAEALQDQGLHIIFSLAGVTQDPLLPATPVRRGGFGGAVGLAAFLQAEEIDAVLDATHPFAAIMSRQAAEACAQTDTLLARLERPAWTKHAATDWVSVASLADAVDQLPRAARVLVTTGRKEIMPFLNRADLSGAIRTIEVPIVALPPHWTLLQTRPPYTLESEVDLMRQYAITHLVAKNAGSVSTFAKIEAAFMQGIEIIMIERPAKPQCRLFPDVQSLVTEHLEWLGSTRP